MKIRINDEMINFFKLCDAWCEYETKEHYHHMSATDFINEIESFGTLYIVYDYFIDYEDKEYCVRLSYDIEEEKEILTVCKDDFKETIYCHLSVETLIKLLDNFDVDNEIKKHMNYMTLPM